MWLLVDDKRSLENVDIIARNHQAAMEILLGMGSDHLAGLVIDYDLGESEKISGKGGKRKRKITGCDILMFAIVNNCLPLTVQIIEEKPADRQKLHNTLINDAKYVQKVLTREGKHRVTYVKPDADEVVT